MDYNTKIKDLVFRLLKEKYPTQFSKFYAEFGSLEITWVRDHIVYDHIPFTDDQTDDYREVPAAIGIRFKGESIYHFVELNRREYLKLQFILEESYSEWIKVREANIEEALTNLVSPTNFDEAQDHVIND